MSQFEFTHKSLKAAIAAMGDDEALSCLKLGWYQKQYRKRKNSIESAILERAQNDPRFKDLVAGVTKEVVDSFGK
jgi:hypothetical protein